jgi:hypothetical protein
MVKLYTDGTIVQEDKEHLVRPVKLKKSIMQGGKRMIEERTLYEKVDDLEILRTFMELGGTKIMSNQQGCFPLRVYTENINGNNEGVLCWIKRGGVKTKVRLDIESP